jgi:hypothetical protein
MPDPAVRVYPASSSIVPLRLRIGPRRRSRLRSGLVLGALLLAGAAGSLVAPPPADAADPAPELAPAATESSSSNWGPIVGGFLGVLFGSLLAAWQIRGMKRNQ